MKDQLMAIRPGYAAGGMPDQVDAFQGRIAPFGVATGATAPNAIPGINAQSLAASLAPEQSGAGVAAPVTAPPAPAAAPAAEKPYGNVFSPAGAGNVFQNPSAGNVTGEQGVNVYTPGCKRWPRNSYPQASIRMPPIVLGPHKTRTPAGCPG
jgi:hypothetical protein